MIYNWYLGDECERYGCKNVCHGARGFGIFRAEHAGNIYVHVNGRALDVTEIRNVILLREIVIIYRRAKNEKLT